MYRNKTLILFLLVGLCGLSAENYKVGDYVADFTDSLCTASAEWTLYDYYGDLNGGDYSVIWLVFFNTTSRRCQLEAAYSQTIQDMYEDQGLVTIGVGSGWSDTYECKDWAKNYGVTYPIINDDRANLKSLFADGTVPYHVIIDHNMRIRHVLDYFPADSLNSIIIPELLVELEDSRHDINGDGQINILDIISLANIILYDNLNELGDINQDGETNILDIMAIIINITTINFLGLI